MNEYENACLQWIIVTDAGRFLIRLWQSTPSTFFVMKMEDANTLVPVGEAATYGEAVLIVKDQR